jgi:glycosyltransferase involved in cell wall biosynthesis
LRIGIYVETVKVSQKTGISRYVIGLVEALLEESDENDSFFLYYQKEHFFSGTLNWLIDHPKVKHRAIYSPSNLAASRPRVWWDYWLGLNLRLDRIDVFHGPNHFLPKTKIPTVLTIHDLAYYYMNVHGAGLDRVLRHWTELSFDRASHIICVSEATRSDCIKEGCEPEKTTTIYQGFETNSSVKVLSSMFDKPYLLFLGTIQPRKNVVLLVEAFALIANKIPHKLVLAGAPGDSMNDVERLIAELQLGQRIEITGFISDQERMSLYQHADCFIYPSKYEGFGLVVLESMSYGVPVITLANSSLPEAVGDAGILVDQESPEHLADAILSLVSNKVLRNTLIKKGYEHIKKFSWANCAQQTMAIYRNLVKH